MTEQETQYWPGTDIPKSLNNGFTLGFLGRPHGYTPGVVHKTTVKKCMRRPGGFAKNNGTIAHLAPRANAFTITSKKRA